MEDIRKLIADEVLAKGHLMSLGVLDDGGVWVSYVVYVWDDDLNIYWLSKPGVRHSKAIAKNLLSLGQSASIIGQKSQTSQSNLQALQKGSKVM